MASIQQQIKEKAYQLGFCQLGITTSHQPNTYQAYLNWIQRGHHQNMYYLAEPRRKKLRQNVEHLMPEVQSVLVGALSYHTDQDHPNEIKFAKYGWSQDYHKVLKQKFKTLTKFMQEVLNLEFNYRIFVDTAPILERDFAQQAGVGWVGKNTMIMNQKDGSNLYLGVMLTTLTLKNDLPITDHCGTCTACIDACPTDALEQPYLLNPEKCISYQTIENRDQPIPIWMQDKLNGWVAGCDICQDACPWNNKALLADPNQVTPLKETQLSADDILKMAPETHQNRFQNSAFSRIPLPKLQQTVEVVQKKQKK